MQGALYTSNNVKHVLDLIVHKCFKHDLCFVQVPSGILPKNEHKSSDMVEILSHLHQYVPMLEYTQDTNVPGTMVTATVTKAFVHPILVGGDQLTVARARTACKAIANEDTPALRLEGLVPVAEDWHTKVIFLKVGDIVIMNMYLVVFSG